MYQWHWQTAVKTTAPLILLRTALRLTLLKISLRLKRYAYRRLTTCVKTLSISLNINRNPTTATMVVVASVIIAVVFNFPFISNVYEFVHPNTLKEWLFIFSIPVLLTCINIIFFTLVGAIFIPRLLVATMLLISAFLFYAMLIYGVIFDSTMIQNVIETDSGEALSYVNPSLIVFTIFLAILPIFIVFRQHVRGVFITRLSSLFLPNVIALIAIAVIGAVLYKDYAAVGRNHKALVKHIVPYAFYDATYKYVKTNYLLPPLPFSVLDPQPVIEQSSVIHPKTLVVVVGETARADKFGSNGYPRDTTPNIQSLGALSFSNVSSCGTATAVSVPCMFSRLARTEYDSRTASSQDNVLDIIHRAGVNVSWIDNNSSCKGVCRRIDTIGFDPKRDPSLCDGDFCYDQVLLNLLSASLKNATNQNRVIVLHMIGSHGPTYYRRYPATFKKFTPDCPRSDIQNCDEEQLLNTYDNTIAYTDYILGQTIQLLDTIPNSAMLYISDHGESLGEKGLYLHGFPYNFAPDEQTHVPMVYWDRQFTNLAYKTCLQQKLSTPMSQDNLYDTLLGLSRVKSTTYRPQLDVFKSCRA